ncbi:MAG: fused MFS/spermidine synthase [Myxococcota bacterium]|nr:fused MFS/spermidine synthase [Myxococcota bacterium]
MPMPRPVSPGRVYWLFATAIFLAAFLTFLIQPMVGKRILPWFGGAPAVWTLCLVFYQTALFFGYAYAYLLLRFVRPSLQLVVHSAVFGMALVLMPALPGEDWRPVGQVDETVHILTTLVANVALPFMALTSTGPLVQAWFARSYPSSSPYPLYAISNLGSLLALLAYPALLEPAFSLSSTAVLWSWAFVPAVLTILGCGLISFRIPEVELSPAVDGNERSGGADMISAGGPNGGSGSIDVSLWLLLPAAAVLMLVGVTNKLCLDVASVPFLWVLPLTVYLLTFVFCFWSERAYFRPPWLLGLLVSLWFTFAAEFWAPLISPRSQLLLFSVYCQIPAYCLLLLSACMMMHGELYRLRPPATSLAGFYLCISGGGAVGGILAGVLVPLVFSDFFEFDLALGLVIMLFLLVCARDPSSTLCFRLPLWRWWLVGPLTLLLFVTSASFRLRENPYLRHQERGFFGVLKVVQIGDDSTGQRQLMHGSTIHGVQFLDRESARMPTSYFGVATGVGLVLGALQNAEAHRVGIIGLGIGTLAAYGGDGDLFRFYEIDPGVVRIARDSGDFRYLQESEADIEVVLGDARLALEGEQELGNSQDFDVLVVDAFNSDSIPVHLLTEEAFRYYRAALAEDGLLTVHVSSRHFDFVDLISRVGFEVGLKSLRISTQNVPGYFSLKANWVILAEDASRLDEIQRGIAHRHRVLGLNPGALEMVRVGPGEVHHVPVWTDDYSNLFSFLKLDPGR